MFKYSCGYTIHTKYGEQLNGHIEAGTAKDLLDKIKDFKQATRSSKKVTFQDYATTLTEQTSLARIKSAANLGL